MIGFSEVDVKEFGKDGKDFELRNLSPTSIGHPLPVTPHSRR